MKKEEFNKEIKEDNYINISLIKSALENIAKESSNKKNSISNQINDINSNQLIIKDTKSLINSIKLIEKYFNYINKTNTQLCRLLKRNINYIYKLSSKRTNRLFKKMKISSIEALLAIIIKLLGNYINEKKHYNNKYLLIMIMRLIIDDIIPVNSLKIIIEIFINILTIILNTNPDNKYSLNEYPFIFVSDIIDSFTLFPKEIKIETLANCILNHIIDIFDKYLITPNYLNICFRESPIWLKILENNMTNPLIENNGNKEDEKKDEDEEDNEENKEHVSNDNKEKSILQKIYNFLIKIYKFDMKDEYFQNIIIPKGIVNLRYYINSMNYLIKLFEKEKGEIKSDSSFKILNGFNLQKNNFLYLSNINLKLKEYSIIFSFKITQIQKDSDEISIINLYHKSKKSALKIYVDKNHFLNIIFNGEINWNTFITIRENVSYLVCLSQPKKTIGNVCYRLFINEKLDENEIKKYLIDSKSIKEIRFKNIEIQDTDSCYYYEKKTSNLDLAKEMILELGKNNFIGIMGELLIINECLAKENIHYLFNLKGNYAKILSQIYNDYKEIYTFDQLNKNKSKLDINKLNTNEKKSAFFFRQLKKFEIKLEIMSYKINRFSKLKYISQNYYNQHVINAMKIEKENNERNLRLMSIITTKSGTKNDISFSN